MRALGFPIAALSLVASACVGQRGLVSERPPTSDAAVVPDAAPAPAGDAHPMDGSAVQPPVDAGAPAPDAGVPVPAAPLALADGCDVQYGPFFHAAIAGTLPGLGPYRPCRAVGGQPMSPLGVTPDSTLIAALDGLGDAVALDGRTLKARARFARRRGPYTAVAVSPSGSMLVAGSEADGEVDLFSLRDETLLWAVDLGQAFSLYGGGLAFSSDGTRVAATVGPDVAVIDVATATVQRYTDGTRCCADQVLFADQGRKLVTARYDYAPVGPASAAVTLLDLATGHVTTLLQLDDIDGWVNLAASFDGTALLAFRESELYAGDVTTGAPLQAVVPAGSFRDVLGVDATGTSVGVDTYDPATRSVHLQLLRLADGAVVQDLPLQPGFTPLFWSLDPGRLLVTAKDQAGAARLGVIDTADGQTIARACSLPGAAPVTFATAAPRLLAIGSAGLAVYDQDSGQTVGPVMGGGAPITSPALSPDGNWVTWLSYLSMNGDYLQVTLGNATTGEEKVIGAPSTWVSAVPSSGGQMVALQDKDHGVTVTDAASGATVAQVAGDSNAGTLVGFSPDSNALILNPSAYSTTMLVNDGPGLRAVDWRTGAVTPSASIALQALPPAAAAFRISSGQGCGVGLFPYASFSADGSTVVVGSDCSRPWELRGNMQAELYDVASGTLIQSFPSDPLVSSDATVLALGSALWCR